MACWPVGLLACWPDLSVRSDRPPVGAQARGNSSVTLQRRHQILVDLHRAIAHVVVGDGDDAVARSVALANAACQQAIAQAELPAKKFVRCARRRSSRVHASLPIKSRASHLHALQLTVGYL